MKINKILILFKLVFGNVNAALKVINASTSSEDVNQLGDVMFNSLLKCVEKATRLDKRYLYTQIRTILTMHRDEFMVLIDSVELGEAQEDFLLPEATRDEISNIVSELFHQYDESINTNDCQTIFRTAIDHFQNEVLNYAQGDGTPRDNPFFIPKMIADIAPGLISIKYGFRGPNFDKNPT